MKPTFRLFLLAVFLCQNYAGSPPPGKRNFIGTQMGYQSPSVYTPDSSRSLIYFESFDSEQINPLWEKHGTLEYYVANRSLRVPVRTLKRSPKAGALVLNKLFHINDTTIRLSLDQTIPSRNPELSSAVFFCPESAVFDENGTPDAFIRYYKRSQVELVEVKEKSGSSKLVWARNEKVSGGDTRHLVFEISQKTLTLMDNDSSVFSIKNPLLELKKAKVGLWVSTKGISESGGNMVFDNLLLESLRGE